MTACPACVYDDLMERMSSYCAAHLETDGYADFAYRAISDVFVHHVHSRKAATLCDAIAETLTRADYYAAYYQVDADKLRAAIVDEARARGLAA